MVILETIICHAAKVEFGASFAVEAREGNWSRKGFFFLAPGGSGLLCWNTWSLWDPLGSAPPLDGRGTTSDSALPDVSLQSRFLSWCPRGLWDPPGSAPPSGPRWYCLCTVGSSPPATLAFFLFLLHPTPVPASEPPPRDTFPHLLQVSAQMSPLRYLS